MLMNGLLFILLMIMYFCWSIY